MVVPYLITAALGIASIVCWWTEVYHIMTIFFIGFCVCFAADCWAWWVTRGLSNVKSVWEYDDPEAGYIYIHPPAPGWEEAMLYQRCLCILRKRIRENLERLG